MTIGFLGSGTPETQGPLGDRLYATTLQFPEGGSPMVVTSFSISDLGAFAIDVRTPILAIERRNFL
jgi:hypothetical protein